MARAKRLTRAQIARALPRLPGWQLVRGREIRRLFEFRDFAQALAFVVRVGRAAESADHHPDFDIRYRRVLLSLSTHSAGGLTARDVRLARRINALMR